MTAVMCALSSADAYSVADAPWITIDLLSTPEPQQSRVALSPRGCRYAPRGGL